MAFVRASGPAQEPPQRQPRGPLMIGIAVLLLFFVPLLVVTAERSSPSPASSSSPTPDAPIPPMPPAGAPWPPPPGAPQPPVCVLVYQPGPDGRTSWTAMTTRSGELSVAAGPGRSSRKQTLAEPEGVQPVTLIASLAQEQHLQATLSTDDGQSFGCLVGRERTAPAGMAGRAAAPPTGGPRG